VCTEHPYIRAVKIRAVFTARIYRCISDTRTYGPYVRVVRTGHPYIRPVQKKHCSQCFSAVRPVYTGSVYRAPVYTARIYGPYIRAVDQKPRPIAIDTSISCGTVGDVGDVTQRHSLRATGKYLPSFVFCIKNTTYIASSLFRSRISEMSVIEDDAAYFP